MYKLDISDQAQVALQLRVSHSDLVYRFLAGPPLRGGGVFHRDSNPLWAALSV